MDASWHAVMRDILIILAALSLTLAGVFGGLVMWQLYRIGRALQREAQPVIDTAFETVATVRDTSAFMGERLKHVPLPQRSPAGEEAGTAAPAAGGGAIRALVGALQRRAGAARRS